MVAVLKDTADSATIERAWAEDVAGGMVTIEVVKAILAGGSPLCVWWKHCEFTLDVLAEQVGVVKGYLSQIENGQKSGTPDLFRRLAGVLNGALDEIVVCIEEVILGLSQPLTSKFSLGGHRPFYSRASRQK